MPEGNQSVAATNFSPAVPLQDGTQAWLHGFYSDFFAETHLRRTDAAALRQTIHFLSSVLRLRKGDTVLDQGCGIGDISLALAAQGYAAVGVDIIDSYIAIARDRAAAQGTAATCRFYKSDAAVFMPDTPCDAAFNWWTSFGYDSEDAANLRLLLRAFDSLKPGGFFALDYTNVLPQLAALAKNSTAAVLQHEHACAGGTSVWQTRLDPSGRMLIRDWTFIQSDGTAQRTAGGGIRVYTSAALGDLLRQAGFCNIAFYGSAGGESFSARSPRCIAVAQKPVLDKGGTDAAL